MNTPNLERLAEMSAARESMTLEPHKPAGEPWGVWWDAGQDGGKVKIAEMAGPGWATWFAKIHNAMPWLIARATDPGPQWTLEPKFSAGTWIARSAVGTHLVFWDGRDEPPDSSPTRLPTYWFGPIPNPPF